MKYTMLLWPHANARYQAEARRLAAAELGLMLQRIAPEAAVRWDGESSWPGLDIESPEPLGDAALSALCRHSLMYQLFERREDGSLMPLHGRAPAALGEDLPAILKYKGKTNELFLQLLINVALYSGDYWDVRGPLEFLDPMCGRATAPFIALNYGWNAVGADVDRADLKEAERFFKRYLEYHRVKHRMSQGSRTVKGSKPAPLTQFEFSASPEQYRAGDVQSLQLIQLDAAQSAGVFPKNSFHLAVCDLPYGVRHDAQPGRDAPRGGNWLEALLVKALPQWRAMLRPGGTLAVSFNAQTFRLDRLRALMRDAGFEVLAGENYDSFEHWVEQAITRDVAVARKTP